VERNHKIEIPDEELDRVSDLDSVVRLVSGKLALAS
jgi:hypothetical protein